VSYRQLIWGVFGILAVVSAAGLLWDKRWSQYLVYLVAAMLPISWGFAVWRLSVEGWLNDHAIAVIFALAPGALMVVVCVAVSLAVFKHFHPAKN
jgi:hypothetical protein